MKRLCTEDDCYNEVSDDPMSGDIVVYPDGSIYPRSLKCWDCRTPQDRKAIKKARQKANKLTNLL